jgi:hypothetical protein
MASIALACSSDAGTAQRSGPRADAATDSGASADGERDRDQGAVGGSASLPDSGAVSANSDASVAIPAGDAAPIVTGPMGMLECGGVDGIAALPARQWCSIEGSQLLQVAPVGDVLEAIRANSGTAAIMGAWNGAAFDDMRDWLLVWGGGHGDYAGNEVYAFDLHALRWSRLSEPSLDVGGDEASGRYPDGLPRARHTYNYLQYVAGFDAMCSMGGAGFFPSGQTGNGEVWCFSLATNSWSQEGELEHGGNIGAISAIDPTTGHIWTHGTAGQAYLSEYAPESGDAVLHAFYNEGFFGYSLTAAIEPNARKFIGVGGGEVRVWDLDDPAADSIVIETTGGAELVSAHTPGFAYDSRSQKLVGWAQGSSVYTLDLARNEWTQIQAVDDVAPTPPSEQGTFGRFRYVASLNVFVLVNAVDEDVYIYRLSQ